VQILSPKPFSLFAECQGESDKHLRFVVLVGLISLLYAGILKYEVSSKTYKKAAAVAVE